MASFFSYLEKKMCNTRANCESIYIHTVLCSFTQFTLEAQITFSSGCNSG